MHPPGECGRVFNGKKPTTEGLPERLSKKEIYHPSQGKCAQYNSAHKISKAQRQSRRIRQPYNRKLWCRTQSQALQQQITAETQQLTLQQDQAKSAVLKQLKSQYGFVADPTKTIRHNASIQLATMPCWYYFSRPSHLAYHDFTRTIRAPQNIRSLLGLGPKFIPTPKLTNRWSHINPLPCF